MTEVIAADWVPTWDTESDNGLTTGGKYPDAGTEFRNVFLPDGTKSVGYHGTTGLRHATDERPPALTAATVTTAICFLPLTAALSLSHRRYITARGRHLQEP